MSNQQFWSEALEQLIEWLKNIKYPSQRFSFKEIHILKIQSSRKEGSIQFYPIEDTKTVLNATSTLVAFTGATNACGPSPHPENPHHKGGKD